MWYHLGISRMRKEGRGARWAGLGEERACSYYCKSFIPTPEAIKFNRK